MFVCVRVLVCVLADLCISSVLLCVRERGCGSRHVWKYEVHEGLLVCVRLID